MARPRMFDHDEARRLYAEGWSKADLARHFGVRFPSISMAVDEQQRFRNIMWQVESFGVECEDCGEFVVKNPYSPHARNDRAVCRLCAGRRRREETLLARLDADGRLRCTSCGEFRPIEEYRLRDGFPESRCRACRTATRTAYRRAHVEEERARERARWKRRRAERAAGREGRGDG